MDPVLALLIQAYGEAEGRRIWGSYQLAASLAEATAKREAPAPDAETVSADASIARAARTPDERA